MGSVSFKRGQFKRLKVIALIQNNQFADMETEVLRDERTFRKFFGQLWKLYGAFLIPYPISDFPLQ